MASLSLFKSKSITLISSNSNHLNHLQTLFGTRLPAVISVSPAYLISSISIIQMVTEMHSAVTDPHERFGLIMREIQGAYIVASLFQITIGFSGLWKIIIWYLTPLAATPLLLSVGLGLYRYCFSDVATCFPIGFSALVLFVFVGKYLTRYLHPTRAAIVRFLAALISIVVMSIVSAFATIAETTQGSRRTDYHGLLTATSWHDYSRYGASTLKVANEHFAFTRLMFSSNWDYIEPWTARLLPSTQFGYIVLTTSAGIMDHEEARRKNVGGKVLGFFY